MTRQRVHFLFLPVLASLLIIGTFFDIRIAEAVYAPTNAAAKLFTIIGTYPFYAMFVFFMGVIFRSCLSEKNILGSVVSGYLSASTSLIGTSTLVEKNSLGSLLSESARMPVTVAIYIAAFVPMFILGTRVKPDKYLKTAIKPIVIMLITITLSFVAVNILKHLFIRPRYRYAIQGIEGIGFDTWYKCEMPPASEIFTKRDDDLCSFPSGHATFAVSCMYIFPTLSLVFPKLRGREGMLTAAGALFGLAVMMSRMVLGAHYLSDTSIGAMVAWLLGFLPMSSAEKYDKPDR